MTDAEQNGEVPAYVRPVTALGALLCAAGAGLVGVDFYSGLFGDGFQLVRVTPVLRGDGMRFYLMVFGEGLGITALLSLAGLMCHLFIKFGKKG